MIWKQANWDSLEVAKLAVPALAALLLAFVGYLISKQLEELKTRDNQIAMYQSELVKKRLELYNDITRKMNRIFSYYFYVGRWKEETPDDIISYKRDLDEIMYSYQPIFTQKVFDAYDAVISALFSTYGAWGLDAKLRTTIEHRKEFSKSWKPEFQAKFDNVDNRQNICIAYYEYINRLSQELQMQLLTGEKSVLKKCPDIQLVPELIQSTTQPTTNPKEKKFQSPRFIATSVGDNQEITQCFVAEPGWRFIPASAVIRVDLNVQNEGFPGVSETYLTVKEPERICASIKSRPSRSDSKARIEAHIEALLEQK